MPFSPGNTPWAPPQGCGCRGQTTGCQPPHSLPLPPAQKMGGWEAREHCCAHTTPQKTRVLVPRREEFGAVGFAKTLVPLSISTAMGCSGKVLRHRVGAGHPKTGQVSRQKQVGPPPSPGGTKEYLFIPSGAAPSGEASVQPWLGRFWLDGACGEGGLRHSGGPITMWEPRVPALHCMGEPGQSCPHGTPSSTSVLPVPAVGTSGC